MLQRSHAASSSRAEQARVMSFPRLASLDACLWHLLHISAGSKGPATTTHSLRTQHVPNDPLPASLFLPCFSHTAHRTRPQASKGNNHSAAALCCHCHSRVHPSKLASTHPPPPSPTMILATAAPPAPTAAVEASAAAAIRNGATHPSAAATSTATKAGGVSTEPVPAAATPWDFKAGAEWYVCVLSLVGGWEGGREGVVASSEAAVVAARACPKEGPGRDSVHQSACLGHNLKLRSSFPSLKLYPS